MGIGDQLGIRTLVLAMLAGPALAALPAAPAAGATFSFAPAQGVAGETVKLEGSGWIDGDGDFKLFLPGDDSNVDEPWTTVPVDDGAFGTTMVVPRLPAGRQSFFGCQLCNFDDYAGDFPPSFTQTFDILLDLELGQHNGPVGTVVPVTGSGWSPDDGEVMLYASRADLSLANRIIAIPPLPDGSLGTESTFKVPGLSAGPYTFFACQRCELGDKATSYEVSFEVTESGSPPASPQLTLKPDKQSVGEAVTVSGTGWSDLAGDVFVYADRSDIANGEDPLGTTPVIGGAFNTTVVVPDRNVTFLTVFACQQCGESELHAESRLPITESVVRKPVLTILPATGSPGEQVVATGTGWLEGEVRLFFRRAGERRTPLGPADAQNGAFEHPLTVPQIRAGPGQFVACQRCDAPDALKKVVPFTVVAAALNRPVITVEPQEVRPGETVTIDGAGWSPDDGTVTVFLEPAGSPSETRVWFHVTPARDAAFSATIKAPDRDSGSYRVVACQQCRDADVNLRATATLTIRGGALLLKPAATVAVLLLLVVALAVLRHQHRRRMVTAASSDPDPQEPLLPPERPFVRAVPDDTFIVESRPASGRPGSFQLPSLDVVARPDPAPLADQVEVRT